MITVGHIAKTYGLLPSEVMARASTFDIMITDVYSTWERHQQNPNSLENYDPKGLEAMLQKVKE